MNSTYTLIIIFKSLSFESNSKDNRRFKIQNSTEHVSFNSSYFKMIVQNICYTLHFGDALTLTNGKTSISNEKAGKYLVQ